MVTSLDLHMSEGYPTQVVLHSESLCKLLFGGRVLPHQHSLPLDMAMTTALALTHSC